MKNIGDLSIEELTDYVKSIGEGAFRAKQIYKWVHGGADSIDEMTNISKNLRERILSDFSEVRRKNRQFRCCKEAAR